MKVRGTGASWYTCSGGGLVSGNGGRGGRMTAMRGGGGSVVGVVTRAAHS